MYPRGASSQILKTALTEELPTAGELRGMVGYVVAGVTEEPFVRFAQEFHLSALILKHIFTIVSICCKVWTKSNEIKLKPLTISLFFTIIDGLLSHAVSH